MSDLPDCVEQTTRFAHSVNDLSMAWAFVMEHLERVGPRPEIRITPFTIVSWGDRAVNEHKFGVVVEGMVHVNCPYDNDHPVES